MTKTARHIRHARDVSAADLEMLSAIAEHQAGVVSRAQAHDAGFTDFAIRTRVASGAWQRVGRALVLRGLAFTGDLHMAWLITFNVSSDAVISGPLAVRLGGWNLPGPELMAIEQHHRRSGLTSVRLLRREAPSVVPRRDGLRLAVRGEALADTLVNSPLARSEQVLDLALQRRWISAADVDLIVSRRSGRGRRGVSRLRHLQRRAASGSKSEAEQRMGQLLKRAGGSWIANYVIRDRDGTTLAELDFADPGRHIAIEVDGRAFHSDSEAFEHDRKRQNLLVLAGWTVLRFTWERIIADPEGVIAEVIAAMARA